MPDRHDHLITCLYRRKRAPYCSANVGVGVRKGSALFALGTRVMFRCVVSTTVATTNPNRVSLSGQISALRIVPSRDSGSRQQQAVEVTAAAVITYLLANTKCEMSDGDIGSIWLLQ